MLRGFIISICRTCCSSRKSFPVATVDAMKAAGYATKREAEFDEKSAGVWGDSELIEVDPKTGQLLGGHDNRHSFGKAAGY